MEVKNQNIQKRRGRPPKVKEDLKSEDIKVEDLKVEDDLIENSNECDITYVENSNDITGVQDNCVKSIYDIIVDSTSYISKITGKSEEYIKDYLGNILDYTQAKDLFNRFLGLISENYVKPHKYSVGDYVWIPEQVVDNTINGYGQISVRYFRKPKKVKISKIIYTTKICYGFEGFSKLQVLEDYCFNTELECQKSCDDLNADI